MNIKFLTGVLLCFLVVGCGRGNDKSQSDDSQSVDLISDVPAEIEYEIANLSDFNFELISNGTIEGSRKAELKFLSNDNISKIYVKNGSYVSAGQRIAELDQFKYKSAFEQAKINLERSKLDLQDVLIGQGYSPRDTTNIPAEVMKIARIKSGYDQSVNSLTASKHDLEASVLRAPFSGVVANLFKKQHNQPGGEPLCVIIDLKSPEVVFSVLESELPHLKINDQISITPYANSELTVSGRVSEINPLVDKNGMVKVKSIVNNTGGKLYEGMSVRVKVMRSIGKRLVVTKTAVVQRSGKKVVFTIKDNKAYWNYVKTGEENSEHIVITEGLTVGDSVICSGNENLAHESPIVTRK